LLFLSYAEEDAESARYITEQLTGRGLGVHQRPARRGSEFIAEIEHAIGASDAFLVLLTPHFLTSVWCSGERELAMLREQDLRVEHPGGVFIHVLVLADTPYSESGVLNRYEWTDLTRADQREQELDRLAARLRTSSPASAAASAVGRATSLFRNRDDELALMYSGLTNVGGQHFWLVISPPQLGKTWLLHRLCAKLEGESADSPWIMRLMDIREQPPEICADPDAILAQLFARTSQTAGPGDLRAAIARDIGRGGQPHLCLLDNAELLDDQVVRDLRASLSGIYRSVQSYEAKDARLAVIIGSRREYGWTGVAPEPGIIDLRLTEFKPHIVKQAVRHLAQQMEPPRFDDDELERDAERVYRLSEGLPGLLVRYLQWIRAQGWSSRSRLDSQELFEEIAHPYVQDALLSFESLFPFRRDRWVLSTAERQRAVLEQTFRILAPYRLFTQSHLRHYIDSDPEFDWRLKDLGWSMEDLWESVAATALLIRPLDEPWQELHAPIRRLLFRYYYRTDVARAQAHREARRFVEVWGHNQAGKEQVIGLVDCLWHEAVDLSISEPASMDRNLCERASKLSASLTASSAYSITELRRFGSEKIEGDQELQDAVRRVPGLGAKLAAIVMTPQEA
jgi:hypothetical protein